MNQSLGRKKLIWVALALIVAVFFPPILTRGLYNAYGPPGGDAVRTVHSLYDTARQRGDVSSILARDDLTSIEKQYGQIESFHVTGRRPSFADWIVDVSVNVHRSKAETREEAEVWIPSSSMKFPPHVNRVKLNSVVAPR